MSNVQHDQNVKTVEEKKESSKTLWTAGNRVGNWQLKVSLLTLFTFLKRFCERSVCSDINEKSIQDQQNELALDGIS